MDRFLIAIKRNKILLNNDVNVPLAFDHVSLDQIEYNNNIHKNKKIIELSELKSRFRSKNNQPTIDVDYKIVDGIDDDQKEIKVYNILSIYGAIYYGRGTNWCTSVISDKNMFDHYINSGRLYIIESKNKIKCQMFISKGKSHEISNSGNKNITIDELKDTYDNRKLDEWIENKRTEYIKSIFDNPMINGTIEKDQTIITNYKQLYHFKELHGRSTITDLVLRMMYDVFTDYKYMFQDLPNLINLDISVNQIKNITSLSNLTRLKSLNISCNYITDITPLQSLINLESLNISTNLIDDVDALRNLTRLKLLDISDNNITDITPLQSLINLESLDIGNNDVTDITPLQSLQRCIIRQ
jgi:Leucine-rich repeat (LRR) protein